MPNMSYCRFHNTASDFSDCLNQIEQYDSFTDMDLSGDEERAMHRLAAMAQIFLDRYEELQEQAELEEIGELNNG